MSVIVVGLEQNQAPLELLDRVSVTETDTAKALGRLRDQPNLSEAVLLSTCLRTEVYAVVERFHDGVAEIQEFLADLGDSSVDALAEYCTIRFDDDVTNHLFSGGVRPRVGRARRVRGAGSGAPGLGAGPGRAVVGSGARHPLPPRRRDGQAGPVGDGHRPGHHVVVPRRRGPGRRPAGGRPGRHPGGRHRCRGDGRGRGPGPRRPPRRAPGHGQPHRRAGRDAGRRAAGLGRRHRGDPRPRRPGHPPGRGRRGLHHGRHLAPDRHPGGPRRRADAPDRPTRPGRRRPRRPPQRRA